MIQRRYLYIQKKEEKETLLVDLMKDHFQGEMIYEFQVLDMDQSLLTIISKKSLVLYAKIDFADGNITFCKTID